MASCVMCGSPIPDDQGSRTCSMCYGDIDHGKDGYYREAMEREAEESRQREEEKESLRDG
jgi:predicted nucleic acid-binding Zn ribbon protein